MKPHLMIVVGLALLASLSFAPSADAQLLWRWFGPKTPDKTAPAKAPLPDPRRVTEVNVEIAWLADPVTFPYYLEAHATSSQLEVRGYVPSKAVREHALRIAQVYSSLPAVDSMKEHVSLLVRPGQMSPQHLQASAQSSLRVALPKQSPRLKVEVAPDGKVFVAGPVNTYEEKVAVSHALRRLHGCTSVVNLTSLPRELAQTPPIMEPRSRTPITKTSDPEPKSDKPAVAQDIKWKPWPWPFGKGPTTTKDEPPLKKSPKETKEPALVEAKKPSPLRGPILVPIIPEPKEPVKASPLKKGPEVVKVEAPPVPAKTPALTAAELQKRVKAAWPNAKNVAVEFVSATQVRITLEIGNEKELDPAAERVFSIPELQNYRADLQFKISAP